HVITAHDTDGAEVVGVVQGDVVGRPGGERGRAGHGEIAAIGDRAVGGDGQGAADGRGAEIQGVHVIEEDVVAAHDADRAEVIGVIEGDVVGRPGGQGGRAGDGEVAAIGDRAVRRDSERATDGGRAQVQGVHVIEEDVVAAHDTDRAEVIGVIERDV